MSERTTTRTPAAAPLGVAGISQYGGVLYHPEEYEGAWRGVQRDRTIQQMLNDPLIGAILLGVEMFVRRVDWTVQAADESAAATEQAEFVTSCLTDMDGYWPGDTLASILTFLGWGWAVLEITYKRRGGLDATPPSRHDDGKIGWDRWGLRPQVTREGWDFAGDDPVALIQRDPMTQALYHIPLAKCLHFRYTSRDNSPEGSTPLRVAYDAWYFKRHLQKIEAIGVERDLAGLPVMRIPGTSVIRQDEIWRAAQQIVSNVRVDAQGGVVMSGDRDEDGNLEQELVLLSTGGQRAFNTDEIIRRYANEVVTAFLANVMRTGQDGVGSYALAETQGGLFQQAIGAHLDTIAEAITEQGILPLIRLNGFDDALAPTLKHGDIESTDLARLGTYLTQLATAGMLADTPELRAFLHEVAGLPAPTAEELKKQMAAEEAAAERMRQQIAGETPGQDQEEEPPTEEPEPEPEPEQEEEEA